MKTNITLKISRLYFLNFTRKYHNQKWLFISLNWIILSLVLIFWFITIVPLSLFWFGKKLYHKKYFYKLKFYLISKLKSTKTKKFSKCISISLIILFIIGFIMIILMVFTIPIIAIILIGYLNEKRKYDKKVSKTKQSYILREITDKNEIRNIKTIERFD